VLLRSATRSGCYRCAAAIVEAGADIERPNPDGITPLLNAIDARNFDIAMYLIDQGANVHVWDMHGRTPLYSAIDMNSFRGNGGAAGGGILPLRDANPQDSGAMDVVHRLLDIGVDSNHQLTRMRPNGPGRGRFADYMMRGGTGPLMVAALAQDHEAMQALLNYGVEVDLRNVFQITPLMAAAGMAGTGRSGGGRSGASEEAQGRVITTIDLLLDAGADVNAQVFDSHTNTAMQDSYIPGKDNEGRTALHAAAEGGLALVVSHLLSRGADPTIEDAYGNTALDLALTIETGDPGDQRADDAQRFRGPTVVEVLRDSRRALTTR
jgi:ankyrin repeat protein